MAKENNTGSFVAAIVLGSSKVTGLVGRKEPDGNIRVLSYVAHAATDFVSKGRIFNVEKATSCFKAIREQLEEQVNRTINPFYVAIDCMGTRSVLNNIEKAYHERLTITQEILDSLLLLNREGKPIDRIYLDAIPLEYKLGSITTTEPLGVMTESIRTQYLNISCNAVAVETIESCFRKAGITIARTQLAATQLATVVTSEQERTSGAVFIDMGSETTTVAVYKGKLLRHLAVIPLGGANITRDIATVLNCEEGEAEKLKRTYGYPDFKELEERESEMIYLRDGGRAVKETELAEIIEARVEEIVQNIKHQVELSGYNRENLVNGLFIIGGGAQLANLPTAFDNHFKEWNIRFLKTPSRLSVTVENKNFNEAGIYNVALALVENGEANSNAGARATQGELFPEDQPVVEVKPAEEVKPVEEEKAKEEPKPEKPKGPSGLARFWKKVKEGAKTMVSDDD